MKFLQVCLLGASAILTTTTFAAQQTLSLGYAQTDVDGIFDLDGVSAQYRYETASPISFLATFSFQNGEKKWEGFNYSEKLEADHLSLLAGPAYRFNNMISVYAVAGLAHTKIEDSLAVPGYYETSESSETNFAYGAGVIFNPTAKLAFNLGYGATKVDSVKLDGFNISVGYRF